MQTQQQRLQQSSQRGRRRGAPAPEPDEQQQEGLIIVHSTVPRFWKRIPHDLALSEYNRFGALVGRTAEASQMSYKTISDPGFGELRLFPLRFLQRLYRLCAKEYGWPDIIDVESPQLSDGEIVNRETLIANERVLSHLRSMQDAVPDADVQSAVKVVAELIQRDCDRLRKQMPAVAPAAGSE